MTMIEVRNDDFIYYIQTKDILSESGDKENGRRTHKTGKIEDTLVKAGHKSTEMVGKVITGFASDISRQIEKSERRPAEWEIEFGIDISAEGNVCILTGETTATIKVKMVWKDN